MCRYRISQQGKVKVGTVWDKEVGALLCALRSALCIVGNQPLTPRPFLRPSEVPGFGTCCPQKEGGTGTVVASPPRRTPLLQCRSVAVPLCAGQGDKNISRRTNMRYPLLHYANLVSGECAQVSVALRCERPSCAGVVLCQGGTAPSATLVQSHVADPHGLQVARSLIVSGLVEVGRLLVRAPLPRVLSRVD